MPNEITRQRRETSGATGGAELATVSKAIVFDVPLAITQMMLGLTPERKTAEAIWAGYDTVVRWATSAVDSAYRSQTLSAIFGSTVNQLLRLQQENNVIKNFVTTSVGKSLGLAMNTEMQALTGKLDRLEAQLNRVAATQNIRPAKRKRSTTAKPRVLKSFHPPQAASPAQTLPEAA